MSSADSTQSGRAPGIASVAVMGSPLAPLDYRIPQHLQARLSPGMRVQVPLGRAKRIGIVVALATHSAVANDKLKAILQAPDNVPVVDGELWQTLQWAARYYHQPLAEVLATALPNLLREPQPLPASGIAALGLSTAGRECLANEGFARAPAQLTLARAMAKGPVAVSSLRQLVDYFGATVSRMRDKGLITELQLHPRDFQLPAVQGPALTAEQQVAVDCVAASLGRFGRFLLDGVTGSGKTEVYLRLIQQAWDRGLQSLVLVPEIGLTPQLLARFRERLGASVGVLHSAMTDSERLQTWLAVAEGRLRVLVGTRSALFTPMQAAGLIIVDEEHDASYKQQEGVRYSARDLSLVRARALNIPVLLGSATPSLETLSRVARGDIQTLKLSTRASGIQPPLVKLLDLRGKRVQDGLSEELLGHLRKHLQAGNQVLVFRNRRGYAPSLTCHECGWVAHCHRCDAAMTVHRSDGLLRCHHCGAQRGLPQHCESCDSSQLQARGVGTERLQEALQRAFPGVPLVRVDRGTTHRRDGLQRQLAQLPDQGAGLLVGTQMLAKGHHLPRLSAVAIIDVDSGLFSADFRAPERLAQLIIQVSGRAGRELGRGEVWLQTYHPEHPLLLTLLQRGYHHWAGSELSARQQAGFPPSTHMALLRGECSDLKTLEQFMRDARDCARPEGEGLTLLGPLPAPLARRANHWRAQLLLQSEHRAALHHVLERWLPLLPRLPHARKIRWSLDVDPQDLS